MVTELEFFKAHASLSMANICICTICTNRVVFDIFQASKVYSIRY